MEYLRKPTDASHLSKMISGDLQAKLKQGHMDYMRAFDAPPN